MSSSGYHGHEDTKLPQNMMASPRTSISHLPHSQPHNMTTLPQLSPHHQNHYMVYGPPLVMQPQQLHHPPMSMNAPLVNPRKRRRSDEPESMGPPATPAISSSSYNFSPGPMPTSSHEGAPAAKPKTKRTRTNIPWTPAEEQQLKRLRDGGNSWSDIAKEFPSRTEGSVKKHWYKDMHYAEFAESESAALLAAMKDYEASKWKVIGQKLGKPAKACEQYAREHFPNKV